MPSNINDIYRRLVMVLLRAPRHPLSEQSEIFRYSSEIYSSLGFASPLLSPVRGIALGLDHNNKLSIQILLRTDVPKFADDVIRILELQDFRIGQIVTGEIRPNTRPARGGDSLGEGALGGQSGTLGCLVEDASKQQLILSCHHVLASINSGKKGIDSIWQPSDKDGGSTSDQIGVLHDFKPIILGGFVANYMDAAVAKPSNPSDVQSGLTSIGVINGTGPLSFRADVEKWGWKTKLTQGSFMYRVAHLLNYPGYGDALFENQYGIVANSGAFSKAGDSGSLVVNNKQEAVGLIFADCADVHMSFANPIDPIFTYFGVTPV